LLWAETHITSLLLIPLGKYQENFIFQKQSKKKQCRYLHNNAKSILHAQRMACVCIKNVTKVTGVFKGKNKNTQPKQL